MGIVRNVIIVEGKAIHVNHLYRVCVIHTVHHVPFGILDHMTMLPTSKDDVAFVAVVQSDDVTINVL
jgi:hypothetical protein